MKKSRYRIYMWIFSLLLLISGPCGILHQLIYYSTNIPDVICYKRFPLYDVENFAVDNDENYYIGTLSNQWTQVFDKYGKYKYTINVECVSFNIDKEGKFHAYADYRVLDKDHGLLNYKHRLFDKVIDADKNEIVSSKEISADKSDDLISGGGYPQEYKKNNTLYTLKFGKVIINDGNTTRNVILENKQWFPLGIGVYFILTLIGVFLCQMLSFKIDYKIIKFINDIKVKKK